MISQKKKLDRKKNIYQLVAGGRGGRRAVAGAITEEKGKKRRELLSEMGAHDYHGGDRFRKED